MALIAEITHASGYALRMLAFLTWFFFWVLTFFPCIFLIGGSYTLGLLLIGRFSQDMFESIDDNLLMQAVPWVCALVANFFVHWHFDLFSIFW